MRLYAWQVAALRLTRTTILRALQPLDALHRRLTQTPDLPPLWLRRHVGPIAGYQRAAGEIATYLACRAPIAPDHTVLDVGCGTGVLAPDILRALGPTGRYVGFDVHEQSIAWARRHFTDPRLHFEIAAIRTPYSSHFVKPLREYGFPAGDGTVDRLLAKSVFTHLLEPDTVHYLNEIRRVLADDGLAVISAFLHGVGTDRPQLQAPALRFDVGHGRAMILNASRPTAGVAYPCTEFLRMVEQAGLRVVTIDPGWWDRGGSAPNFQDLLVLARAHTA